MCAASVTERVLVLRGGALGDLILTLPALRALRTKFPGARILLFGTFPQAALAVPIAVDKAQSLDSPSLVPLFVNGGCLSRFTLKGFDLAISYLFDPEKQIEQSLLSFGVRKFVPGPYKLAAGQHAAIQLFTPLEKLGVRWEEPVPLLPIGLDKRVSGRVAVHIGSGSPSKNWPLNRWVQFVAMLEPLITELFVIAGEADKNQLEIFQRSFRSPKIRILENVPLLQLAATLATCEIFVGHDSGVSHLAAAVGTRAIVLFGPTDPMVWAPIGQHVTVVRSPNKQMDLISIDRVREALSF